MTNARQKAKTTEFDVEAGKTLRKLREKRGITQEKLADGIGITFQQIQKYEKGVNRIPMHRAQTIAKFLNVSPMIFFEAPEPAAIIYKLESCHEIGYNWHVEAPADVTQEEVEAICDQLTTETDTPDTEKLINMLNYCDNVNWWPEGLDSKKIHKYMLITLHVTTVSRNTFTQSFERIG